MFKRSIPDRPDAFFQQVVDYMRRESENDPLALLQVFPDGAPLNQLLVVRCVNVNLDVTVCIAQSSGATIATNVAALWGHLHTHTRAALTTSQAPSTQGGLPMKAAVNPFDS